MRHLHIELPTVLLLATVLCGPSTLSCQSTPPVAGDPGSVGEVVNEAAQDPGDDGLVESGAAPTAGSGIDYEDPAGNAWFERTRRDLGTVFDEESAKGDFAFRNPTADTQKLTNITASCTCSKAVFRVGDRIYELTNQPTANALHRVSVTDEGEARERVTFITVGPGERGKIEVFMDMEGIQGPRESTLELQTSDGEVPQVRLQWRAVGASYFTIDPPSVNLNEMSWKDRKEFYFEIRSPLADDFEITGVEGVPEKMTLDYEKSVVDGKAVYRVNGVYGPGVDPAAAGGQVTFLTDIDDRKVTVPITAFVQGPIEMKPGGFFSLGYVRHGTGKSKTIRIWPTDEFELRVESLGFKALSIPEEHVKLSWKRIEHTVEETGTKHEAVEVTVELLPTAPRKTVRGELVIELNHPAAPTKEILFNGFVR